MAETRFGVGPHLRGEDHTRSIMVDVLIALAPSYIWGVYAFGFRVLVQLALGIFFAAFTEWLVLRVRKGRGGRSSDLSAAVTGAILVALLPVSAPLWLAPLGAVMAILVFKHLFGGLGKNILNPALSAFAVLYWIFPSYVTRLTEPFESISSFAVNPSVEAVPEEEALTLSQFLTGSVAGGMASVSAMLLLAGGLYLLVRKVISWQIPVGFLLTVGALAFAFPGDLTVPRWEYAAFQLASGSLVFAAVFLATDPVTSPTTRWGKLLYGVLLGFATAAFRGLGFFASGAAVLLLSLTSRFWDFLFRPRIYGQKRNFARSFARIPGILTGWLPKGKQEKETK